MKDPACLHPRRCANIKSCKGLCNPLVWVNGNVPRREMLLSDMSTGSDHDAYYARDYKSVISDVLDGSRCMCEEIKAVTDIRRRAILLMLNGGIKITWIMRIMHIGHETIRREIKKPPHTDGG